MNANTNPLEAIARFESVMGQVENLIDRMGPEWMDMQDKRLMGPALLWLFCLISVDNPEQRKICHGMLDSCFEIQAAMPMLKDFPSEVEAL